MTISHINGSAVATLASRNGSALSGLASRNGEAFGASYDADATAVFNAMATMPDATRKGHINTLITALKTAGIWAGLDHFVVCANTAAADGLLDWKNPSTPWEHLGTQTFVSDRGFTVGADAGGAGVNAYLRGPTNYNALTNFQQNDCHFAVWNRTAATAPSTVFDFGNQSGDTNTRGRVREAGGAYFQFASGGIDPGNPAGDAAGFWVITVPTSTSGRVFKNGAEYGSSPKVITTAARAAAKPIVGGNGVTPTYGFARQWALIAIGADVAAEQAAYYSAVSAYMTAVGAA